MKKVYALGCLQLDTSSNKNYPIKSQHLCHLYAKFEDAERCVLENRGDLFEYYYNYALIEEILVIDPSEPPSKEDKEDWFPPKEYWYHANYDGKEDEEPYPKITKVEKPDCLNRTVYFWVG